MLSIADDLGPPPAYTPHDPQTPSTDVSHQLDTPISPLRPSIRGGYLSIVNDPQELPYSFTAAYFESRPFHCDSAIATILIEHKITPHTTPDDLPLQSLSPGLSDGMEVRDVHAQDWATFVNYIIAELNGSTSVGDQNPEKSISRTEFRERQKRIEAVVAEWNEGFFGPRKIRFVPEFSYAAPGRSSSPTPSYRTIPAAQPAQECTSFGSPLPQQAVRGSLPTFWHRGQPQVSEPDVRVQPRDGPGTSRNSMDLFAIAGGRGFHVSGRGHRGDGRGRHERWIEDGHAHHGHPWEGEVRRGRSASTSSSSSDEDHDHHTHRRRGKGRRGRSSSSSSSTSNDHHGRGKGRHHRSSSTCSSWSSSSSSSNNSVSSISSDELRGVEVTDIRQAIANFRLDPTRKQHVKQAVRQLRSELRAHRKSVSRGNAAQSKAMKAEIKTQKRLLKSEVKSLRKEAKLYKKGLKQQRRAEKRMAKAEKRAKRRGRGLNISGFEPDRTSTPGSFAGQLSGSCDIETGSSLHSLGQDAIQPQASDSQRGLGTGPYQVDDSSKTTAYPFRPTTEYSRNSRWSNEKQDLATRRVPRGSNNQQPPGVASGTQVNTTSGLWGVGDDAEEMRRRALENATPNQSNSKRLEVLGRKQEKEVGSPERQAENRRIQQAIDAEKRKTQQAIDAEHRKIESERAARERKKVAEQLEKDAELRAGKAHKAAELRKKQQERDAARRKQEQERAAAERERAAARQLRGHKETADMERQRRTSQTTQQEDLIDIGVSTDASQGLGRGPNPTTPPVTSRAFSGGVFSDRLGASIGEWGTRFGRDAGAWGERFGRDMEARFS